MPTLPEADNPRRKDDLVVVEETEHYTDFDIESAAALFTLDGAVVTNGEQGLDHEHGDDNESMVGSVVPTSDDLIFLTDQPPAHLQRQKLHEHQPQQQKQQQSQHTNEHRDNNPDIYAIDLLTVVEDLSSSFSSSSSASSEARGEEADVDPDTDINDTEDETVPREIELQTDDLPAPSTARLAIDMHDFVALIPADEVKTIVANYYRNDPEVQRAYTYLSSPNFAVLKQNILAVPELSEFLRYLNASGLDVMEFFHTLTNLTTQSTTPTTAHPDTLINLTDSVISSETLLIEFKGSHAEQNGRTTTTTSVSTPSNSLTPSILQSALLSLPTQNTTTLRTKTNTITLPTTSSPSPPQIQTTTTTTIKITTSKPTETTSESLNGLHGLVDSILDVLPQDQILTTFFDKLETNEQFSKLVDNVGSPAFANILQNMKNSPELRNLIFVLHNNGIYVTRIMDSLKAYFFLGTF